MSIPLVRKLFNPLSPSVIFIMAMGILLQLQITLGRSDTYLGLRLCAADILLPLLGTWIVVSLILRQSQWPTWRLKYTDSWMTGLTAILLGSFLWGWIQTGEFSTWAFVNRLLGWGVLLGYFYGSAWIATNLSRAHINWFLYTFALSCLAVGTVHILAIIAYDGAWYQQQTTLLYPVEGFSANRNAFSLIFLASLSFSVTSLTMPTYIKYWAIVLTPLMIAYNGSRMMTIALLVFFVYILCARAIRKDFRLWGALIAGITLLFIAHTSTNQNIFREHQDQRFHEFIKQDASFSRESDQVRSILYKQAIESWQEHPIFGVGLGANLRQQMRDNGKIIDLIDSVPLWLLCEMGLLGMGAFSAFGLMIARTTWIAANTDSKDQYFYHGMIIFIFFFILMASVHQLLYTRFLWVLLGISLGLSQSPTDQK